MYKVTIQSTPVGESNWSVVTTGTWNPGERPQLAGETLPANVVEALFKITPSAMDQSRRNQVQDGDIYYAVVVQETFEVAQWFRKKVLRRSGSMRKFLGTAGVTAVAG
jgi:hypothetical protein